MKPLIFLYAMAFAFSARASFYQTTCSNADGSVRLTSGQLSNQVRVKTNVDGHTKEFKLDLHKVKIVDLKEEMEISREVQGCGENATGVSVVSSKLTSVRTVEMNIDSDLEVRKPFENLRTILLCETNMNNRAFCGK